MSDKTKKKTIIVLINADCISYHPPPPISLPPCCACCVYAQILISLFHTERYAGEQRKTGDSQHNGLSHKPIITLQLQKSFPHYCDDVAFRKVSTVRYYCLPPHVILSKDTTGKIPITLSIHLNMFITVTQHVSSQALISIHVCHTR